MEDATLKLPEDLVAGIIRDRLNVEIVEAFGGKTQLIEKLVLGIMQQRVDSSGKAVRKGGYDDKSSMLEYLSKDVLEKELKTALKEWFVENAQVFRDELIHQLSLKKVQKEVANAMVLSLQGAAESKYNHFFRFSFVTEEKED